LAGRISSKHRIVGVVYFAVDQEAVGDGQVFGHVHNGASIQLRDVLSANTAPRHPSNPVRANGDLGNADTRVGRIVRRKRLSGGQENALDVVFGEHRILCGQVGDGSRRRGDLTIGENRV